MVNEARSVKKPVRPAACPARLGRVVAVGRHVGRDSPRPPYRCLRQRIGPNELGGNLPRRRILGTRSLVDAQNQFVRDTRRSSLAEPMGASCQRDRSLAMARSGHQAQSVGLVCVSGPAAWANLRDARPGDPSRHGGRTDHGQIRRPRRQFDSRLCVAASPAQRGDPGEATRCTGRRRGSGCGRSTDRGSTLVDGSNPGRPARSTRTIPNGTHRTCPTTPQERRTRQGQTAAPVAGPNQRHRSGSPPWPRQGESFWAAVYGSIRRRYRIVAGSVLRCLCSTDRCGNIARHARPYSSGHGLHGYSNQHRCGLRVVARPPGVSSSVASNWSGLIRRTTSPSRNEPKR